MKTALVLFLAPAILTSYYSIMKAKAFNDSNSKARRIPPTRNTIMKAKAFYDT